ncbi:MAG: nucleotidyltransferase domain-containing protein [Nanoarchaeota archaeon]|nr:nucleotidyltransferase domain-containing protein [Nanoarchaeota archaeon]
MYKKEKMGKKNSDENEKIDINSLPSFKLTTDRDIAMDFAEKVYQKFDKLVKSMILFGSVAKDKVTGNSDIDIIIIIDDAIVRFDEKLIMWYREELGNIIRTSPYKKDLHVNTIKLSTWWNDLLKGDPTVINVIRYGETIIDLGGFFNPLKILLDQGKIKATPESLYVLLNRVPEHIVRSKISELSCIEGCYWAIIESAQALLMSIKVLPPSPEFIAPLLKEHFVKKGLLKEKDVDDIKEIYDLHKRIIHNQVKDIDGRVVDMWQNKSDAFFKKTLNLINEIISV